MDSGGNHPWGRVGKRSPGRIRNHQIREIGGSNRAVRHDAHVDFLPARIALAPPYQSPRFGLAGRHRGPKDRLAARADDLLSCPESLLDFADLFRCIRRVSRAPVSGCSSPAPRIGHLWKKVVLQTRPPQNSRLVSKSVHISRVAGSKRYNIDTDASGCQSIAMTYKPLFVNALDRCTSCFFLNHSAVRIFGKQHLPCQAPSWTTDQL